MPIENEDECAHAPIESNLGNNLHARIYGSDNDNGQIDSYIAHDYKPDITRAQGNTSNF